LVEAGRGGRWPRGDSRREPAGSRDRSSREWHEAPPRHGVLFADGENGAPGERRREAHGAACSTAPLQSVYRERERGDSRFTVGLTKEMASKWRGKEKKLSVGP
ncbi:hypothetical protein EMIHUDRAFT_365966, partial [Emiliania huxleyi CCMP1516]